MIAIYARVSTADQAEKGYSLDDQLLTCREQIGRLGLRGAVEEFVDDGYSGEYLDRPELDRLRDYLQAKKITHVITHDPDRLSRNLTNQLVLADEIESAGAALIFVTASYDESPEGKLFFQIRGSVAAFEKAKIRERTMRGKRAKARSGKLNDDKALGYDFDKTASMYIINEQEAEIIRQIFALSTQKRYSVRAIVQELNLLGYKTKNGKRFYMAAVYRILKNEMYAGTKWSMKNYDKMVGQHKTERIKRNPEDWIPVTVPAIIDKATWDAAQQTLQDNKIYAKRNTKGTYMLSHIIRCGVCGAAMHGMTYSTASRPYFYRYYICNARAKHKTCQNRRIPVDAIDNEVWKYLLEEAHSLTEISFCDSAPEEESLHAKLEAQLKQQKASQAAMLRWVREGTVDIATAERELQTINKEISLTMVTLRTTTKKKANIIISSAAIINAITLDQKRRLLRESGIKVYAKREANADVTWAFRL